MQENVMRLQKQTEMLQLCLAMLIAERFTTEQDMRDWTERTGAEVMRHALPREKQSPATAFTAAAYQQAWDALLASVRAHWQMLRARKTGG